MDRALLKIILQWVNEFLYMLSSRHINALILHKCIILCIVHRYHAFSLIRECIRECIRQCIKLSNMHTSQFCNTGHYFIKTDKRLCPTQV